MNLKTPSAPVFVTGESISIDTEGKVLVLPTGNPMILPSFNEYTLNSNRLTIAESPFGGLKGSGSPDYCPGTISTSTTGVQITDLVGGNGAQVLSAGRLAEMNLLSVDTSTHTISEEFIIENTNESNVMLTDAESLTGWATSNSTIALDTIDFYSGTSSIKAIASFELGFGAKYTPPGTFDFSDYVCIIVSAKGLAGKTGRLIVATDSSNWISWDVLYSGNWDTFTINIASPDNALGTINLSSVDSIAVTMNSPQIGDVLYIDEITAIGGTVADLEIRVPSYLYNYSFIKEFSTILLNDAESLTGWATSNSAIALDTIDFYSGTSSIKAIAIFELGFGAKYNPPGTFDFSDTRYITVHAKGLAGKTGRLIVATDSSNWISWDVLYSGNWDTFTINIASPDNASGTINLSSVDSIAVTMNSPQIGDVLYIDEITATYPIYSTSFLLQCWDGFDYQNVRSDTLANTYENVTNVSSNLKYLNGSAVDSVYGSGNGVSVFPSGEPGETVSGTKGEITYSFEKGTKSRIGLKLNIPDVNAKSPNLNKIRLKFIITYSNESLDIPLPPILNDIVIDHSKHGNDGTNYNTTIAENRNGNNTAFSFDGVDDYITLPSIDASRCSALQHSHTPCLTPTYDGSGQAVHPSVLYFENGWNGYTYWMAMTPYPGSDDQLENPSILASNDGDTWVVPNGVTNPLYPVIAGHNNDADLVYDPVTDSLRIYWLDTRRASECVGSESETWYNHQFLMMISSTDGVNWSAPQVSIDWDLDTDALEYSPSIVRLDATHWRLYTTESYLGRMRESADGITWGNFAEVDFGDYAWHITVRYIPSTSEYWMISNYPSFPNGDLRFGKSSDGLTFTTFPALLLDHGQGGWDNNLYRTTFLYDSTTDIIDIWYTGVTNAREWHIGRITTTYQETLSGLNNVTGGITLAGWIYPTSASTTQRIFNKYSSQTDRVFTFSMSSSREIFAEFWSYNISKSQSMTATSTATIPLNTWTFVAVTFDGSNIKLYINGQLDSTTPVSATQLKNSGISISVGKYDALNSYFWDGKMSDLYIYSRPLSSSEISELYIGNIIIQGLEGHWGSDMRTSALENAGATVYEFSNDANTSTGLQNLIKPWIAIYDPASSEIDFYLFTHRPKNLAFKRNESGQIYEVTLYPGNGLLYHGQITYNDLTRDSNSDLIPDFLDASIVGSLTSFLQSKQFECSVIFAEVSLRNWQTPTKSYMRPTKETELLSGNIHVSRSSKVIEFPKTFLCYAENNTEIGVIENLINENYSTLTIDGLSYENCYVYQISDIWEVKKGSGIWTYSIEFRQADVY